MSLQAARQLLQELDVPTPPPTDSKRVCQVLKGLLESYEQKSEQARKFNDVSRWSRGHTNALTDEATA